MTQQEFIERTGVNIGAGEYSAIELVYLNSDLGKDDFCKVWMQMNKSRVQNAKIERIEAQRAAAFKDALYKWFNKWSGTKEFFDNYNTSSTSIKYTVFESRAFVFAGIKLDDLTSLSDIHFKVGQYLGIYRSL